MRKFVKRSQSELDQITLNIEFLVINIVQGFAIVALAESAVPIFTNLQYIYFPYIVSGFLITCIFWSESLMHAVSFIRWPIDFIHSFLYFLAGILEVMIFMQLGNPLRWFLFSTIFFIVAFLIYLYDFRLIKLYHLKINHQLLTLIMKRQRFELLSFILPGLAFNSMGLLVIYFFPTLFIKNNYHVFLIFLQLFAGFYMLFNSLKHFKDRMKVL